MDIKEKKKEIAKAFLILFENYFNIKRDVIVLLRPLFNPVSILDIKSYVEHLQNISSKDQSFDDQLEGINPLGSICLKGKRYDENILKYEKDDVLRQYAKQALIQAGKMNNILKINTYYPISYLETYYDLDREDVTDIRVISQLIKDSEALLESLRKQLKGVDLSNIAINYINIYDVINSNITLDDIKQEINKIV